MSKITFYFDMDGTITDLYGVEKLALQLPSTRKHLCLIVKLNCLSIIKNLLKAIKRLKKKRLSLWCNILAEQIGSPKSSILLIISVAFINAHLLNCGRSLPFFYTPIIPYNRLLSIVFYNYF